MIIKINPVRILLLILFSLSLSNISRAQTPTYELRVANESQPSPTTYEFDVFLLNTGSTQFELQSVQFGLGWDTTILMGGNQSYSMVTVVDGNPALPALSELAKAQVPASLLPRNGGGIVYNIDGIGYRYFSCAARLPPGAGFGTKISKEKVGCTHPGTRVARFRLTNSVPFRKNSTCKFIWSTSAGSNKTNTVLQAYPVGGGPTINISKKASHLNYNSVGTCVKPPNGLVLNPE